MKKLILVIALIFIGCQQPRGDVYRGFNLSMYSPDTGELTLEDFQTMKQVGATLIRLDFSKNYLMAKEEPYQFNEDNFVRLHKYIGWAEETGLKVVIDPHTFPGTILPWTIMGHDKFWFDKKYYDLVVKLWDRIAKECAVYGDVIWAYDLVNEPYGRGQKEGQVWDLNNLYKDLIKTIRQVDEKHSIILMFRNVDFESYAQAPKWYGDIPERLIYSPHFYIPQEYTHQGVGITNTPLGTSYPNLLKGWNRLFIEKHLKKYRTFADKHGVEIFFGEFSCAFDADACWDTNDPLREKPKRGGDKWLKHVIGAFEKYGYHWTYHCYEDWKGWDATVPYPRWVLLQELLEPGPLHPGARIDSPLDNQIFNSVAPIEISASAWDKDGGIALVEFFINNKKIGETKSAPYSFTCNNVKPGSFRIDVRASDNSGASISARPVDIAVQPQLPAPWKNSDIGRTAAPGSAFFKKDTLNIFAVEDDLYNPDKGFHAVLTDLDNAISAQFIKQDGKHSENRCGIFAQINNEENYHFSITATNELILQHNSEILSTIHSSLPCYLRVTRQSETLLFEYSKSANTWMTVKNLPIMINDETKWGFAASANKDVFINRVQITDISLK